MDGDRPEWMTPEWKAERDRKARWLESLPAEEMAREVARLMKAGPPPDRNRIAELIPVFYQVGRRFIHLAGGPLAEGWSREPPPDLQLVAAWNDPAHLGLMLWSAWIELDVTGDWLRDPHLTPLVAGVTDFYGTFSAVLVRCGFRVTKRWTRDLALRSLVEFPGEASRLPAQFAPAADLATVEELVGMAAALDVLREQIRYQAELVKVIRKAKRGRPKRSNDERDDWCYRAVWDRSRSGAIVAMDYEAAAAEHGWSPAKMRWNGIKAAAADYAHRMLLPEPPPRA